MEGRPLYRTVAAIGLAAHALSSLVHVGTLTGDDRSFFLVLFVVAAAAAAVTWSWTKGIWVSLVLGLALEVMTFWFVFPLVQGFALSALDAVPAMIGFVGVWTAIIASIRGVMKRREDAAFTDSTKRKLLTWVAVVAVLAVASTGLTFANKKSVSADAASGATEVVMHNGSEFSPTTLEANAGEETKFLLKNDDPFAHTFDFKDKVSKVSEVVGPGSEVIVTVDIDKPGRYEYFCEFHADMKGTMVVT